MDIPRHWTRAEADAAEPGGRNLKLVAWGWSSRDLSDAASVAAARLSSLVERVKQGLGFARGYAYGARPIREEIVEEFAGLGAVVTRNRYGALILNTARLLFLDVDQPPVASGGFLKQLFGRKAADPEQAEFERLRLVLEQRSGASFRVYRTAAGFRVLATDREFDPGSDEAEALMSASGTDPAFVQLCRVQKSFRARLTPKPWRCDAARPPGRFPYQSPEERARFAAWLVSYERACEGKATCRFLGQAGPGTVDGRLQPIIEFHDRATRATASLALA